MADGIPTFDQYIGIDYSGAKTPVSSLKGLRVYKAERASPPVEVSPPPSSRKYWTRRGIAEWLVEILSSQRRAIVGIDHAFSFPLQYFQEHQLPLGWDSFLDDFQNHWPTDGDLVKVDFVRKGMCGNGACRWGETRWRRLTEKRTKAKSVFHFDVQGQVAKSTHAGLPWLRHIRKKIGDKVHFWPFDGWAISNGKSAVVEVYPALWKREFLLKEVTSDQQDAYSVAAWLRQADIENTLHEFLEPNLSAEERNLAEVEGWILGVS